MKKTNNLTTVLIAMLFAFTLSCNNNNTGKGSSDEPGAVVQEYYELWNDGKAEKIIDIMYNAGKLSDEDRENFIKAMKTGKENLDKNKKGINRVEILNEKIDSTGIKATVKYRIYWNDSTSQYQQCKLVKENEQWKMRLFNINSTE